MNEQIRLLAKQAGYVRHFEFSETQLEKFAALIIQECAEMGDNFDGQPVGNAVREYLTAGDAIREYFGVEE